MLHRSLARAGSHAAHDAGHHGHAPAHIIKGSAPYTHSTTLSWIHAHKELNYRKKALGWGAYSAKNCDVFAPFANTYPARHIETKLPGMWMGAGHLRVCPEQFGWRSWKFHARFALVPMASLGLFAFMYWWRIAHLNGWTIKNKGAVSGGD